jgi:hypothetical protein
MENKISYGPLKSYFNHQTYLDELKSQNQIK